MKYESVEECIVPTVNESLIVQTWSFQFTSIWIIFRLRILVVFPFKIPSFLFLPPFTNLSARENEIFRIDSIFDRTRVHRKCMYDAQICVHQSVVFFGFDPILLSIWSKMKVGTIILIRIVRILMLKLGRQVYVYL